MTRALKTSANLPALRHDGWTPDRQARFLDELAASHCVSTAAKAVGMSRQSAYALRARMRGEPFDLAWAAALMCRFDALAEAAMDRALNGVEVPHYYKGELVGTSRRFDERLTVALLAMRAGFAPAGPPYPSHPSAGYGAGDFGRLVERVAAGPETWDEEWRIGYDEAMEECAGEEDGEEPK
ncbi:hypothetical protein [Altererythrobacter lauratis]|uniref:Helix-turn-helix domain-containing protein n=1 Tax=Alteraurantiacibacter lauratis TaxID=2054627 RepID=A0ABV7EF97_9SPHN